MLNKSKSEKLQVALKLYHKKYLSTGMTELDESGTRILINSFLTDVLGYASLTEVKTEYMIKGTYADYVVQCGGIRHFLVEVKALSFALSDKHLRQAVNYGANEGIEWALLTNGKSFDLYKILFNKPIESVKVFSFDISDTAQLKKCIDIIQFLHRDSVMNKGLDLLWSKTMALDPCHVAGLLYSDTVINHIRKSLKDKFKSSFTPEEVVAAIERLICEPIKMESVKPEVKHIEEEKMEPIKSKEDEDDKDDWGGIPAFLRRKK